MPYFMIVIILYINFLNLSLIKISIFFEEYGVFNIKSAYASAQTDHSLCCPHEETLHI